MLTQRQQKLLMILAANGGWQTSAQLAELLGVSSKLVKQEIAAIRVQLGEDGAIQSNTRRGYRLARLSDTVRASLLTTFDAHSGHHSITRRYALVYLCLLFNDEPLSMARLAERLFCSKAAVADQVEVLRYRTARLAHLRLEVSKRSGVSVLGPEVERRYEGSKWVRTNRLSALFRDVSAQGAFARLLERTGSAAEEVLGPLAAAGRLSGGDVLRVGRYLALTVERSQTGHMLDTAVTPVAGVPVSAVSAEAVDLSEVLAGHVDRAIGYRLDALEHEALARLLAELLVPDPLPREAVKLARDLTAYVAHAIDRADGILAPTTADALAGQLAGMLQRVRGGHALLNYHASETAAHYPLASYLTTRFLKERVGLQAPKAETMLIALSVANVLDDLRCANEAILLSDEPLAVTQHLSAVLRASFHRDIGSVRVLPTAAPVPHASWLFTTDPSCATRHPGALLFPAMLGKADSRRMSEAREKRKLQRRQELAGHLVSRARHDVPSRGLEERLALAAQGVSGDDVLFTAYRTLCLMNEDAQRPSAIAIIQLRSGIVFQGKTFRTLIEVSWNPADLDPFDLSAILSDELSASATDSR